MTVVLRNCQLDRHGYCPWSYAMNRLVVVCICTCHDEPWPGADGEPEGAA